MSSARRLRVNPGGRLRPWEVVGCHEFIGSMWDVLPRQSVVLAGERRMGKTSVLGKMLAEAPPGWLPIKRSLQGVKSPEEFVRALVADTEQALPGVLKRSLGSRLQKAGIKQIGVSAVSVEFDPPSEESWKDIATDAIGVLDREPDLSPVLLWDELPHMVANVRHNRGPHVARDLLDLLRAARESHDRLRMVFSGSIGLHHVVRDLRAAGGMWVPTHDMRIMDLPPLHEQDAVYLAGELLRNEGVACDDGTRVAAAIADEVDCVPYYVHYTVNELMMRQRGRRCGVVDAALVRNVVDAMLGDPQDMWQLHHYVERVDVYYGDDADCVKAVLDIVAAASRPPTLGEIHALLAAYVVPPSLERLRDLLLLLSKDHYLTGGPRYCFRLDLVRRIWRRRRP